MSGTITIRVNDAEEAIINQAAAGLGMGRSSLMKKLAFDKLEDEYDIKVFEEYEEKKAAGKIKTKPIEELWAEMGL